MFINVYCCKVFFLYFAVLDPVPGDYKEAADFVDVLHATFLSDWAQVTPLSDWAKVTPLSDWAKVTPLSDLAQVTPLSD